MSAGPGPQRRRSGAQHKNQRSRGFRSKRHEHFSVPKENNFTDNDPSAPPESQVRRARAARPQPNTPRVRWGPSYCCTRTSTFLNLMKTRKLSCSPALLHAHFLLMLRSYGSRHAGRQISTPAHTQRSSCYSSITNQWNIHQYPAHTAPQVSTCAFVALCTWSCFRCGVGTGGSPATSIQS